MDTNVAEIAEAPGKHIDYMETIETMGMEIGFRILGAVAILIVGFWIVKMIKKLMVRSMERKKVDPTLIGFVSSMVHAILKIAVIIAALEVLHVKTASFIAVLGAAGLAVGLALQGSLSNFAAGVLMIIFKPIGLKDYVEINGISGTVREIGILATSLDTMDNKRVVVPNSNVMSNNIVNYSLNSTRRVDLTAGISYSDDIDKARGLIEEVLGEFKEILPEPEATIFVSAMADSSVNFAVRPWCKPEDYWTIFFGVTEGIKKKFDAEGITIPFPQRDVHLYEHKED